MVKIQNILGWMLIIAGIACSAGKQIKTPQNELNPTRIEDSWLIIDTTDLPKRPQHLNHYEIYKKYVSGYNLDVIRAIDIVQATAMDGGEYFVGIKADPPESPIGYELKLLGHSLLTPPRTSSYCSGSSYAVFIEALNLILSKNSATLSPERVEAMRMQEADGGRREDLIKFWGYWNADGPGCDFALRQYSDMGAPIEPEHARPGDFMNIQWKKGNGHSVVFLGWYLNAEKELGIIFWSSQKSTNGFGDVYFAPIESIKEVRTIRLTHPEKLFSFDINQPVSLFIPGDTIRYPSKVNQD